MIEQDKLERLDSEASSADAWGKLVPLAEKFLENQNRELEKRLTLETQSLEVTKMESQQDFSYQLKIEEHSMAKFRHFYWLFAALLLFFMGISAGLIFIAKEVKTGTLILTHLAIYGSGLLSGLGLKKLTSLKDDKDND